MFKIMSLVALALLLGSAAAAPIDVSNVDSVDPSSELHVDSADHSLDVDQLSSQDEDSDESDEDSDDEDDSVLDGVCPLDSLRVSATCNCMCHSSPSPCACRCFGAH